MMMMIATILLLKVCDIIKFDVIFHTLKQKVKFIFEILILLWDCPYYTLIVFVASLVVYLFCVLRFCLQK